MTDQVARLTAALADRYALERELGAGGMATVYLADDLKQMLRRYLEVFNSTALSAVLPSLAGERFHNPELSVLFEPVTMSRRRPLIAAFERAMERGEIASDIDLELASDLVVGPIAVALFFKGGRLRPEMVGPMVDLALRGLRADGSQPE